MDINRDRATQKRSFNQIKITFCELMTIKIKYHIANLQYLNFTIVNIMSSFVTFKIFKNF